MAVQDFVDGYIETALWSSTDDDGESLDMYELSDSARRSLGNDARGFYKVNRKLWPRDDDHKAGGDFWLTRNHHGAGFWDGGYDNGDELTEEAHAYGSCDLYVGDDELVYVA